MFRFFRSKPKTPPVEATATASVAPGTEIRYRPDLITDLKRDHKNLLSLYSVIQELFSSADYHLAEQRLGDFKALLHQHLLTERIHLYIFMEHLWPRSSEQYATMHAYRTEMEGIGKAVVAFLRRYDRFADSPELISNFKAEFDAIGKVLVRRIEAEEANLYTLYRESA